jgi:hypothetical protein
VPWGRSSEDMDNDRYIWCRNCDAIYHVTDFDRAPIYTRSDDVIHARPVDDRRDFMREHAGHRLEAMRATGASHSEDKAPFDPMAARYIELSDGQQKLLVRRSRASIQDPFRYEVVDGRLVEVGTTLEVQDLAIRKEMKLHFSWEPSTPLDDAKIDLFLGLFRDSLRELDPTRLRVTESCYEDENVSYGELDTALIDRLFRKCHGLFSAGELESIRRFVETHREAGDVMAVIKRRSLAVAPRA